MTIELETETEIKTVFVCLDIGLQTSTVGLLSFCRCTKINEKKVLQPSIFMANKDQSNLTTSEIASFLYARPRYVKCV